VESSGGSILGTTVNGNTAATDAGGILKLGGIRWFHEPGNFLSSPGLVRCPPATTAKAKGTGAVS
jgi:hypothetical protein